MTNYFPPYDVFQQLAREYPLVPVYRCLAADTITPVVAYHRLCDGHDGFLFESVVGGEQVGRYSFLGVRPFLRFSARGYDVQCDGQRPQSRYTSKNPLAELRNLLKDYRVAPLDGLPPFVGGAVGYLAYDVARYFERLPQAPPDDRRLPDILMGLYDHLVIIDNARRLVMAVVLADTRQDSDAGDCGWAVACRRVDAMIDRLTHEQHVLPVAELSSGEPPGPAPQSNTTRESFENAVRRCVEYIRAGDIFQVVISQRLKLPAQAPPLEHYRSLRMLNPSPFMFLLETPQATLIGSSPEIMCRVVDRRVTVRPLAGTRARAATPEEDDRVAEELLGDPKERAEHVMLVDLGRNDVGRVAQYGTVELSDVMTVERYSHVMHLTSNVCGILRDDCDAFDALASCLPAGTVSGAPKIRAMQIIDELEPHRRGPYAGAVGYFDFRGNMDTCITLRTIVLMDQTAYVQCGAGIVADSQPAAEYQETLNKAEALLKAIRLTEARCTR